MRPGLPVPRRVRRGKGARPRAAGTDPPVRADSHLLSGLAAAAGAAAAAAAGLADLLPRAVERREKPRRDPRRKERDEVGDPPAQLRGERREGAA